jgi:hypothetical protein
MMKTFPCLTAGLLLLNSLAHAQVVPPSRPSGSGPAYPYPPPGGSGGGQSFGATVIMFIVMGVVFYGGIYVIVRIWDFLKRRR